MKIKESPETAGIGAVLDFHDISITGGVGYSRGVRFSTPIPVAGEEEAEEK